MTEVDCYRHTRLRLWSIREGGRVARHVPAIALRDVRFIVRAGAVARVQARGVREVCAFARGTPIEAPLYPSAVKVAFDPFEGPAFLDASGLVVTRAALAHFMEDGTCFAVL